MLKPETGYNKTEGRYHTTVWLMNKKEADKEFGRTLTDDEYNGFMHYCIKGVHAQLDMDIIYDAAKEQINNDRDKH